MRHSPSLHMSLQQLSQLRLKQSLLLYMHTGCASRAEVRCTPALQDADTFSWLRSLPAAPDDGELQAWAVVVGLVSA